MTFEEIVNIINNNGGGKMVIDAYEKHHYLFPKGKSMESIKITTRRAIKLSKLAKESEGVGMGRVKYWF